MQTLDQAWNGSETPSIESMADEMKAKARAKAEAAQAQPQAKAKKPAPPTVSVAAPEPPKANRGRKPVSHNAAPTTPHATVLESIDRELREHERQIKRLLKARKAIGG